MLNRIWGEKFMLYYIIVTIVALCMIFCIIEISYYNKFQIYHIKISEALNNMDILFEKEKNLLERCVTIMKDANKKYKNENLLDNLVKIQSKKIDRFEWNHELTIALREYYGMLDLDKKLSEIESLKNINEDLGEIDNDLKATKKYYNDNIVFYNKLVKCFPSSIVAKLFHYQKKEFFKDEKIETLEILKEK